MYLQKLNTEILLISDFYCWLIIFSHVCLCGDCTSYSAYWTLPSLWRYPPWRVCKKALFKSLFLYKALEREEILLVWTFYAALKSLIASARLASWFLATLVALHFTPVSEWVSERVSHSFGWRPSSVAWSLRACWNYGLPLVRFPNPHHLNPGTRLSANNQKSSFRNLQYGIHSHWFLFAYEKHWRILNVSRNIQTDWSGFHPAMFYPLASLAFVW